jgi:hypothetical protein
MAKHNPSVYHQIGCASAHEKLRKSQVWFFPYFLSINRSLWLTADILHIAMDNRSFINEKFSGLFILGYS